MSHPHARINTSVARSPQQRSPTKRPGPPSTTSSPRSRTGPLALTAPPSCFVSADARIEGSITLGEGCVLHPKCKIIVNPGAAVVFGDGCVVEENAILRALGPGTTTIGENNVFMVASFVDLLPGPSIGSWNSFSPRSRVEGVIVGDQCTFGAGTSVGPQHLGLDAQHEHSSVRSRSVVYGAASEIRKWDGSGAGQEKNVRVSATEFLREVLPKSNKQLAL